MEKETLTVTEKLLKVSRAIREIYRTLGLDITNDTDMDRFVDLIKLTIKKDVENISQSVPSVPDLGNRSEAKEIEKDDDSEKLRQLSEIKKGIMSLEESTNKVSKRFFCRFNWMVMVYYVFTLILSLGISIVMMCGVYLRSDYLVFIACFWAIFTVAVVSLLLYNRTDNKCFEDFQKNVRDFKTVTKKYFED